MHQHDANGGEDEHQIGLPHPAVDATAPTVAAIGGRAVDMDFAKGEVLIVARMPQVSTRWILLMVELVSDEGKILCQP